MEKQYILIRDSFIIKESAIERLLEEDYIEPSEYAFIFRNQDNDLKMIAKYTKLENDVEGWQLLEDCYESEAFVITNWISGD
jgi:hypothetical protein